jgi:predicted PurR-regulated permease PerM
MRENRFYLLMLVIIGLVLGYFTYQVMLPFIIPIAWAGVLCILFYPIYELLRKRLKWRTVAAIVTLVTILLVILGPFSYLSFLLANEIKELAGEFEKGELFGLKKTLKMPAVQWLIERVTLIVGDETLDVEALIRENFSNWGKRMAGQVTTGVRNVASAVVKFVLMAVTIFFFLRDGEKIVNRLRSYLPFAPAQRGRLESQAKDMIVSTIFGGVVVALIQGLMGGTAFYFLKVPSPVIWGTAISIMSFIPMLGAASVWGSLVVYLFLQEAFLRAFILLLVGTFGISLVDNILKPIIIGERTKMPTLLILFSVLGGIKLFGLIGLIMGPMSVALFISVLEIFRNIEGGTND